MNKFKVYVSWYEPCEDVIEIIAEDEDQAIELALKEAQEENGECDDMSADRVIDLGEVEEEKEPIYVDPNQMSLL